jgi:hypothetical protein
MANKSLLFSVTLKDCKVEALRSSKGAGGQHRDKTSSAIRVTHEPSGATGFSQEYREQHRNKPLAFKRMSETSQFQVWVRMKALDIKPIDEAVAEQMAPENIRVEFKQGKKWVNEPIEKDFSQKT